MSNGDGVDTPPEGRKRRPTRRSRATSGTAGNPESAAPGGGAPGRSGKTGGTGTSGRAASSGSGGSGGSGSAPRGGPGKTDGPGRSRASRPRPGAPRFAKPLTPASLLGWTALSAIVPGAAHLRAGHRRTGLVLISVYAVLLLGALAIGLSLAGNLANASWLAHEGNMMLVVVISSVLALCWFAVLATSYAVLGPNRLNQHGQIVTGIVVGVLCVAVMSPFALTANYVVAFRNTVGAIFPSDPDPESPETSHNPADPWNGRDRVNFLLIGGDAAGNRTGVRTDSMNVASVDLNTGATVLFSLPRNLQHVRFPSSSPLHKQFPNGFMAELPNGGLLNEVWQYANDNPQLMGGKNKGPRALMDAIGFTLGLKIDYYMLMNMYGFADLVDAIGGLRIKVTEDVKWGGLYGTAGTIKAGYRKLTGEQALWYGRSRVGSDDFSRMSRQRCVIGAFAQQATPSVILTRFEKIAGAAKRLAQTNIPQGLLPALVELAVKVKDAKITSLQFVPPEFYSGRPDWAKIRTATRKAVSDSLRPRRAQAANVSASPSATASPSTTASPGATASAPPGTRAATPTETPTRNNQKGAAQSLDELCGL